MNFFKWLFSCTTFILLTGCYYSDGCLFLPQSVSCFGDKISDIERYEKNVSPQKKEQDIKECLGDDYGYRIIPDKNGSVFQRLREKYPNSNDGWKKIRAFSNCMRNNKGYLYQD